MEEIKNITQLPEKRVSLVRVMAVKEKELLYGGKPVRNCEAAAELGRIMLENADRELLLVCCLDSRKNPISIEIAAMGSLNGCYVQPREVFKNAILSNAESIILIHNHVSGDPEPSEEDYRCTERLYQAGKLLGIPVLDHIIIGAGEDFVCLAESEQWKKMD